MTKKFEAEIDSLVDAGIGDCLVVSRIFEAIPYDLVNRALLVSDRKNRRLGDFPDQFVIYFVVLMSLFMELSYDHAMTKFREALRWFFDYQGQPSQVSASAIVQARQRITFLPLVRLFELIAQPLASHETPNAFFRGLRKVVIDGTNFDVADTKANAIGFGRPSNQYGGGAYPQVRCVALIEQATRAVIDLVFGPVTTSSENSLARELLARLKPGFLCLADRLYPNYEFCQAVISANSHFVWRVRKDIRLAPIKYFHDDGSYLAKLYTYSGRHRHDDIFLIVRVVEYTLAGSKEVYRLITSILDPEEGSADEIARMYPQRWTQETFNGEIKTTLRKPRIILRSQRPDQVIQELYGLFTAHYVVRSFMSKAASVANIPPDTLSFSHSVFVLKHQLVSTNDFSP